MFNLNASEYQLDFETIYGSSKQGWMSLDWKKPTNNINVLLQNSYSGLDSSSKIKLILLLESLFSIILSVCF